jgi:transposase
MRKALPTIRESADDLKHLLKQEHHPARQQRLHGLYLLASGHARSRQEVATLLGVDRNTVGRWLATYERGGLVALLAVYIPAGKRKPLTPDQLAQLQQALGQPHGFASYGAIRQWIADTFGVQLSYNAVHKLVRYKLRAKLKVPRPSHIKKRPSRRHL